MGNLIDALHNYKHPLHGHAIKVGKAAWENGFGRDPCNSRVIFWRETGTFATLQESQLANYLGMVCDASLCAAARAAQAAAQVQAEPENAPTAAPAGITRCLCDGEPVSISPGDWWREGRIYGCDYTVDATGSRHWGDWRSHRFTFRPKI